MAVDWVSLGITGLVTFAAVFLGFILERQWERVRERRGTSAKRSKVLALAVAELDANAQALNARGASRGMVSSFYAEAVSNYPLKDELWGALSDGGELQWVSDLAVLDGLAEAYHWVRFVKRLENKLGAENLHGMRYGQAAPAGFLVLQDACSNALRHLSPLLTRLKQMASQPQK